MQLIFRWNEEYFGFIYDGRLFDAMSGYLGWIEEDGSVWRGNGHYLGELAEDTYILRNNSRTEPMPRPPRLSARPPRPPMPPMKRKARIQRMDWVDALDGLTEVDSGRGRNAMVEPEVCNWTGASGTVYNYAILKLPVDFAEGEEGNYIHAKRNATGQWVPIYIGEGDLAHRASHSHHQAACIETKGATHIHAHRRPDAKARKAEEQDLLERHTDAYEPVGCNEKPGG